MARIFLEHILVTNFISYLWLLRDLSNNLWFFLPRKHLKIDSQGLLSIYLIIVLVFISQLQNLSYNLLLVAYVQNNYFFSFLDYIYFKHAKSSSIISIFFWKIDVYISAPMSISVAQYLRTSAEWYCWFLFTHIIKIAILSHVMCLFACSDVLWQYDLCSLMQMCQFMNWD